MLKNKFKAAVGLLAAATMALSLAGCGGGSTSSQKPLIIGYPNGQMTNNQNPLSPNSASTQNQYRYAIYEPLFIPNSTDPTMAPKPWLATKMVWNTDYTKVTFTIRDGVKFTDGKPMTAKDVAFSFNIGIKHPALNSSGIPYDTVSTSGNTVTVTFKQNMSVNESYVYSLLVLPEHIWNSVNPETYLDQKPVGTGPFMLKTFTPSAATLTANPNYWGGKVPFENMQVRMFNDNTALTNALVANQVDFGFVFIANNKKVFLDKNKYGVSDYVGPLNNDSIFLNTQKGAFKDITMRKALNMALDRQQISDQATTGAAKPIISVTGLPQGTGDSFIAPDYKGVTFKTDVAGAKALLTKAGYTGVGTPNGLKDPQGNPVTVMLTDPAGWSDYDAEITVAGSVLNQLGVKTDVQNPQQSEWQKQLGTGDFDAAVHWTDAGSTPYNMYHESMGADLISSLTAAGGTGNFGRYNNPTATDLLKQYANSPKSEMQGILNKLEKIYVDDVPVVPILSHPIWANYSTKNFTGWPTDSNRYGSIDITQPSQPYILMHLKPVKK